MQPFSSFNTFILRTPLFPIHFYTSLLKNYNREAIFKTLDHSIIKSAIALASPELLQELEKYRAQPQSIAKEKINSLEQSLVKYLARLSSRATPFGLFAGCTTGVFHSETAIQLQAKEQFITHTQFDMQFWTHFLQELGKKESVREQLLYFPNTSLYVIGDFYRYIEYQFVKKKREHTLAGIRKTDYLDIIFKNVSTGKSRSELVTLMITDASEREDALAFINDLIDNQFLVSNLEATVTGNQEIKRALDILANVKDITPVIQNITEINLLLQQMTIENHFTVAQQITEKIKKLEVTFDEKYLLQTDLYLKTKISTLNYNIRKQLQQAIAFLERTQVATQHRNLEAFKKAFLHRYETKEMPLTVVLDSEIGIGYLQDVRLDDSHPILDQFSIHKQNTATTTEEKWTPLDYILETKLKNTLVNKEAILELKDNDFNSFLPKKEQLPSTFSAMIEVVKIDHTETVVLESLGNYSAAKLMGRFSNGDTNIYQLAKEITEKEATLNPKVLLAEVAHIPESRTGNVLRRPVLREYEIPYLSNSTLPKEQQINITDLYISIENDTIILKSKKQNKRVIPCLSNAHNYSSNSLPIYHFLCDLQGQQTHPIYTFDWGVLHSHYSTFPRVVYKGVILAKAKWYISEKETKELLYNTNFFAWKALKRIPKYVTIVSGDNTLLLDMEVEICFNIMQKTIKANKKIVLEEFLFTNDSVVNDKEGNPYANQFIVSFYNE
ncbi:lantibiotic dehydratase family protein [Flavobacterium sp. J27]|uniref:lantibiotic dehydratase family protein n=1 Tax=Flavobacterium sp. J27 TaxID=2060419 RepID=UPI0010316236|nr:lantibiotic dehydratase family protein [Flavobacterium sp. J27]